MDYVIQPAGNRYIVRVESPNTKRAYQIRFVSKPTEQDIQDALKQLDSLPLQQAMQFRIPDRAGAQSPSVSMRSQSQSRSALPNIPAIADISQWKGLTPERLQEYNQQVEESKKRIAEDQSASALVKGLYGILNIPLRASFCRLSAQPSPKAERSTAKRQANQHRYRRATGSRDSGHWRPTPKWNTAQCWNLLHQTYRALQGKRLPSSPTSC